MRKPRRPSEGGKARAAKLPKGERKAIAVKGRSGSME